MTSRFMKHATVLVFLSFVLSSSFSFTHSKNSSPNSSTFRRAKNIESSVMFKVLNLMGTGLENAPSFTEGLALFRQAVGEAKLTIAEIDFLQGQVGFMQSKGYLSQADAEASRSLLNMARYYASGLRRDQVKSNDDFRMLRFAEIKRLATVLQNAWQTCIDSKGGSEIIETQNRISAVVLMAAFWATSPVSVKPMLEALRGGNTAIMAVNIRMTPTIPGVIMAANKKDAPYVFETAMTESNLVGGYTGLYFQDTRDSIQWYSFLIGYDKPYGINADHTTVAEDKPEKVQYAIDVNLGQLKAGFTMIASDPSALVAVREPTQLVVLNGMKYENYLAISGIDEETARSLASHGEFKSLSELPKVAGMDKSRVDSILGYLESEILTGILNRMTVDDLRMVPLFSDELIARIAERIGQGGFRSLNELRTVEGLGDEDKIRVEEVADIAELLPFGFTEEGEISTFDFLVTYLDFKRVIELNEQISPVKIYGSEYNSKLGLNVVELGTENEVGHIGRKDPFTGEAIMTKPLELIVFILALQKRGIHPDVVAVNNGTVHGNVFKDGKKVGKTVDIDRTTVLGKTAMAFDSALAQHGFSGTPDEIAMQLAGYILKANVGTQWQNIIIELMPESLFKRMVRWLIDNPKVNTKPEKLTGLPVMEELSREQLLLHPVYAQFISDNFKFAIKEFKTEIDNMDPVYFASIVEKTMEVAAHHFDIFNAAGRSQDVTDYLGWDW